MQKTTNVGLNLPDGTDKFNVDDFNENFRKIDALLPRAEFKEAIRSGTDTGAPKTTYNENIPI
jgi:hypothetical protein